MEISKQVISLEQAKKLQELGVTAEPVFYHVFDSGMKWRVVPTGYFYKEEEGIDFYPAYTVAELGEMLPDGVNVRTRNGQIAQFRSGRIAPTAIGKYGIEAGYTCSADYHHCMGTVNGYDAYRCWKIVDAPTEAQARAAMLIYLLENNLLSVEDINKTN